MPTLAAIRERKRNAKLEQLRQGARAAIAPYPEAQAGFHAQACYTASQAADKALKALTRMNSQSRYPSADAAPADLFDAKDSQQALETAARVVEVAAALLAG